MRRRDLFTHHPLRVAASLLLVCAFALTMAAGATSAPRIAERLAAQIGPADGVLAQTVRVKAAKPAPAQTVAGDDPEEATDRHPGVAVPAGTAAPGPVTSAARLSATLLTGSPAIRAPPRLA